MHCLASKAIKCNSSVFFKKSYHIAKAARHWFPATQAVYLWRPILLEKCQKAQIPCIPPFSY